MPDLASPSPSHAARVTVGLPFLNAERTLADAVRSVFAQTYTGWTLLLVDDGSSDGSLALARAIRDPRVTVLSDGQHRGLAVRLNQLAAAAATPLLARMDADDLMHPERLARQVAWFDEHPATQLLGTATFTVDGRLRPVALRGEGPPAADLAGVLRGELLVHATLMWPTGYARAHPYDPGYPRAEDLALWCAIRERSACDVVGAPLYFVREATPVDLGAYSETQRSKRRLLLRHGGVLPPLERWLLLAKTFATVAAYRLAAAVGWDGFLVRRLNRPLADGERRRALEALDVIRRTRVPGWDA
jgi:glycosyltransferase involved in cell wall biosynthesis